MCAAAPKSVRAALPGAVQPTGGPVPGNKLTILVSAIILLLLAHDFDHFARGDFRLELTARTAPVMAILTFQHALLGFGLYLYRKNLVGPRYW
jgi:hypothetical protein